MTILKKTFKSALALISASILILGLAACGTGEEKSDVNTPAVTDSTVEESIETEIMTDEAESATSEPETPSEEETEESVSEDESAEETTDAATKKPETQEDIVKYYNDTINSAYDKKVGFYKERVCDNENLDAGVAFQAFKSLVYKFMGIGADNKYTENVSKGQWDSDTNHHYLRKSTLTVADITSADCKEEGDNYVITLGIKPGSTVGSASNRSASTPIDKSGICVGNEDKGYYDHKTGPVIYDAIDEVFSGATVNESYSNATVKATINAETGNLVSLIIEYDIQTAIDTGKIGKATASGTSHIRYNNFVY